MQHILRTLAAAAIFLQSSFCLAQTKLVMMYAPTSDAVASFLAKDLGYFDEHGLDIDFVFAPNPAAGIPALNANSVQISTATPTSVLQADEQGLDLVVVAGTDVFVPGSPSTSVADLIGKKVAVPVFGSPVDVLARRWLANEGIDSHRVNWTEVNFFQKGDALKGGLVDAVVAVTPFYDRILDSKAGYALADFMAHSPAGTMPAVYSSTRVWAAQHADLIQDFRAALDEAATYYVDPSLQATVIASVAKWTKLPPQDVTPASLPRKLQVRVKPEQIAFWISAMRDQGMIKSNLDAANERAF